MIYRRFSPGGAVLHTFDTSPSQMWRYGMWDIPVKAIGVLCSDGERRTAQIHGQPDTAFSIPATVKAYGKTVSGFLTTTRDAQPSEDGTHLDLAFIAYEYGKNGRMLPGVPRLDDEGNPANIRAETLDN